MCCICVGSTAGRIDKPGDNDMRPPLHIIFGAEWRRQAFDVWPGGGKEGEEKWRQSPPVSGAKQHHGNGLMPRGDE